ncbi:MAG TPA: GxxExxY protein [Gammaproteobacteria bacterium]
MIKEEKLTYQIRSCVYEVYRELGHGFLEKVYENALLIELKSKELACKCQVPLEVKYKNKQVGQYFADLIVEDRVIIEVKAQDKLTGAAEAQLLNYMRISGLTVGLLVNFTYPKATVKRLVL